jgi:hypothetical protein
VSAQKSLTAALQKQVLRLEDDLRVRVEQDEPTLRRWQSEHRQAVAHRRTAASWQAWRDDRVTQAAVGWVLTTVFVRFCEDNRLVEPVWIAGPPERRQEALDAELAFYRERSSRGEDVTARDWLLQAVEHLAALQAAAPLVDEHAALHLAQPSGDAAGALLSFWRERGDDGALAHDFTDAELDTRFLGDLYEELSEYAQATFALRQTPEFVEEFILQQTLEPALAERQLEGFRIIDPTCGSGHFLLGAFNRLLDRWQKYAPGLERQALVQEALDAIHGVDLNPFAVAIAQFRLTLAALKAAGMHSLKDAPGFKFHLVVGDSLLHGPGQQTLQEDADLAGFTYATEDLAALQEILKEGRYDVVVGNPPYITVKDKALNQEYRTRYKTCKGKYALTVPFMERFFDLAKPARNGRPAGWVGQITSNSFTKREFGSRLVEEFLSRHDLRLVVDSARAFIPGHATPTLILVARRQPPVGAAVRSVLGVRGEAQEPKDPEKGRVWRSIVEHVGDPGWDDGWVTVLDLLRSSLARHPWSLTGGGAVQLKQVIEAAGTRSLGSRAFRIGFSGVLGSDDLMTVDPSLLRREGLEVEAAQELVIGDGVRDYLARTASLAWYPYDENVVLQDVERFPSWRRHLWPYRTELGNRATFGGGTYFSDGRPYFEWHQLPRDSGSHNWAIAWAEITTHNHFVLDSRGRVFNKTAPIIKLPGDATEGDHLELLAVLNSSVACFWLQQVCYDKGAGGNGRGIATEQWEHQRAFNGSNVGDFPLLDGLPVERGRQIDALAQQMTRLTAREPWAGSAPTAEQLAEASATYESVRFQMIAQQEELDWEVYRLYGLIDDELTYSGDNLPGVALGERAFEIALACKLHRGDEETAWFTRHGSSPVTEIPAHWPAAYGELVQRRLDLIKSNPSVRLLEQPEHKRRWAAEPWGKRQTAALRNWLLDRLEDRTYWFDRQGRPAPRSVAQLGDEVARDKDIVGVLALWEGRPDVPVVQSLVKLLADEAVPYLAAYRYKDSGLRKREAWEHTWALQRREDGGESFVEPIPVPPKYQKADFRKDSDWQARGKLDVPKERFILYPDAGRETDPTPLLGWAGWDHAQQSIALSIIIGAREADGWDDARLVPLVAGLAELQPWVEQWHSDMDPTFGVTLAAFCREQLAARASQVGQTLNQLTAWRPQPATRGRRPRGAAS